MNVIEQARQAYAPVQPHLQTPRSIEARAFSEVTARLSRQPQPFADLVAALHDNRTLWTLLASDVADPANGLPTDLRAQIFYLSEFTDHHTRRVLQQEAGVEALVDINLAVLRGLNGGRDPS